MAQHSPAAILDTALLQPLCFLISYYWTCPSRLSTGPYVVLASIAPGRARLRFRSSRICPLKVFDGLSMNRPQLLIALSPSVLLLVFINGIFKLYINTYKSRLGERILRRIRFTLIDRVLRFPPTYFKRAKSSEIATMIKDEVEPLGGFTGDAFVQPALSSWASADDPVVHHCAKPLARNDRSRNRGHPGSRHTEDDKKSRFWGSPAPTDRAFRSR